MSVATLVFTDIEGSTRLWEQDGEAMSTALARHDALSRTAVETHHGVVVKMTGDGMYAAFDDPLDALHAIVMLQQSLAELAGSNHVPLRIRAGLHLGLVERRDDDLFGNAVNRAARIMKAAHGGQILLSQAVVDGVHERLPDPLSVLDLGAVRLRDLATSEHVYQLVHPQIRREFPALRTLESAPNNLPQQATSFVGRERELTDAKALLGRARLVTLLGMGGLGKTRLSLQIGADVLEKFPDGVWFVDLAPIRDASLVPDAVAQVLGIHEEPGKPLTRTLCGHVKELELLLIFDNCEHLVGACATLAAALLSSAPKLRIVATSREALRVPGEQTYPVLPLAVPDRSASAADLLLSEAVQLFVERARLQRPEFTVTERDAPAVAELCARLEGIPLALELAAARLRSLSVAEINTRLNDRFKLLTGGSRVALERQQTLRALVSWSYDLLQENEQILLDRLSCFAGGFDLEAAEEVCGADPLSPEDVLDLVTSLVEKSLLMVDQSGGSRYGMLETIREFARGHKPAQRDDSTRYGMQKTIRDFAQDGLAKRDDLAATSARHCEYFLRVAKRGREKLEGPEQAEWTRRLEVELDNLRIAIALGLSGGVDPVVAVKFEVALMRFRILRGYSTEARKNVRSALALPEVQAHKAARAHALYVGGVLATNQSDYPEATRMLTECLAIRRGLDNLQEIAAALSTLATMHLQQGDATQARTYEEEALGIFRKLGDRVGEGVGLLNLGEIEMQLADERGAKELLEKCLSIARSVGHKELESECERKLGDLALVGGDLAAAETWFDRSFKLCRDAEDKRGEAIAVWCLAKIDAAKGDHDSARRRLIESLRAFKAFEMIAEALDALEDYGALLAMAGEFEAVARLLSATTTLRDTLALPVPRRDAASRRRQLLDEARAGLAEAIGARASSEGTTWSVTEALDYALALPTFKKSALAA